MILGPLLLLCSTIAAILGDGLAQDTTAGILQVYAFVGLMLALFGLTSLLENRAPKAAAVLTLVGALGITGGVAYGINTIFRALGTVDLNQDVEGAAPPLALQLPGILFPLTFIGLGMLLRAGARPRWCGAALVVAGVLFPISRIGSIEALAPVPDLLFLLGLAPLGWALLQGRAVIEPVAGRGVTTSASGPAFRQDAAEAQLR